MLMDSKLHLILFSKPTRVFATKAETKFTKMYFALLVFDNGNTQNIVVDSRLSIEYAKTITPSVQIKS